MLASFVHLRVHSEYSLVDSVIRVKQLVARAAESMPAVALTDQSNMFAMVKFYKAALAAGIKPLVGVDVWLENPNATEPLSKAVLLAQNMQGYHNITRLVSRSYQEGQSNERAIIQRDWLFESSAGIIVLSGGRDGEPGQAILGGKPGIANELAGQWKSVFGDRYYLELQRTDRKGEMLVNNASMEITGLSSYPGSGKQRCATSRPRRFQLSRSACLHT